MNEVEELELKIETLDIIIENLSVNSPDRKHVLQELYAATQLYEKMTGRRYMLRDDGK